MFPETKLRETSVLFSQSYSKNKQTKRRAVNNLQFSPGRDTFEFDQGHVTKNQPITELILSSESLAI